MNTLQRLRELGQSPWYDNVQRGLIKSGELKRLFDNGLLGVTSNPTIFQKAVESCADYDEQITQLHSQGKDALQIYDELTIEDVRNAADLLRGIYASSDRDDGLVSIEVPPMYAHDPEKTITSARALFKKIDRENILIKIPGTAQSGAAIRKLISEGINVNVTLLFSAAHYETQALSLIHI